MNDVKAEMEPLDPAVLHRQVGRLMTLSQHEDGLTASRVLQYVFEQVNVAVSHDGDWAKMAWELQESDRDRQAEGIPDDLHSQVAVMIAAAALRTPAHSDPLSRLRRYQDRLASDEALS